VKIDPAAGVAVSVTLVPTLYGFEQSVPQLIPAGLELTLPAPAPARTTESGTGSRTVSVVLALAPAVSVAVIVVVPALTPTACPRASTVATAGSLLVHAIPVPVIVSATEEPVAVPFPSWPQSFVPDP